MINRSENSRYCHLRICDAIELIDGKKAILPAIQRKFVWTTEQIECLFDSIMNDYPINTMIWWNIDACIDKTFQETKFYAFQESFKQTKDRINTLIENPQSYNDSGRLYGVIDGQQRLNSIYLALKGYYDIKKKGGWSHKLENYTRYYLCVSLCPIENTSVEDDNSIEPKIKYSFRFLPGDNENKPTSDEWFCLNDYYRLNVNISEIVESRNLPDKDYAIKVLEKLRNKIFEEECIWFYEVMEQNVTTVLEMFIRTNDGGTKLANSDLLLAKMSLYWPKVYECFKELRKSVRQIEVNDKKNFNPSNEFIVKTLLVIYSKDIHSKVTNLTEENISTIKANWKDKIQPIFIESFRILKRWGLSDKSLRAYNAVIPIVFFIHYHDILKDLQNQDKRSSYIEMEKNMCSWMTLSLLKKSFSGQSDNVLTTIRNCIRNRNQKDYFPLEEIKNAFKSDPQKNLAFNTDDVAKLLSYDYNDAECYQILSLLYVNTSLHTNTEYNIDHVHPQVCFTDKSRFREALKGKTMKSEDFEFALDRGHWNSIVNLQLLDSLVNKRKNATSLTDFMKEHENVPLIPQNVSYDLCDFRTFYERRKELLVEKLESLLGIKNAEKQI